MTGFTTEEGHAQEFKVLGLFPPSVGIGPCISAEFKTSRFLLSQFQMELPHSVTETF